MEDEDASTVVVDLSVAIVQCAIYMDEVVGAVGFEVSGVDLAALTCGDSNGRAVREGEVAALDTELVAAAQGEGAGGRGGFGDGQSLAAHLFERRKGFLHAGVGPVIDLSDACLFFNNL